VANLPLRGAKQDRYDPSPDVLRWRVAANVPIVEIFMASFTTIYRAIVMVAAGIILVKGWQLYGPSTEQVKSLGARAAEMAHVAWSNLQSSEAQPVRMGEDPRLAAAPPASVIAASVVESAPLFSGPSGHEEAVAPITESSPAGGVDRLPALYSQLKELGAFDPQMTAWGSSGQMYRFQCRAALGDTPAFARHFEAVAAEPLAAVQRVVANVEAWRATQREGATRLR
jgi:hypothetical protein